MHGHAAPDAAVELVSYRLRVIVPVPKLEPEPHALSHGAEAGAEREVVFELGYTTQSQRGGSGIGLAVSRDIVESLGGKLTLDARSGGGTRATILLPCAGTAA